MRLYDRKNIDFNKMKKTPDLFKVRATVQLEFCWMVPGLLILRVALLGLPDETDPRRGSLKKGPHWKLSSVLCGLEDRKMTLNWCEWYPESRGSRKKRGEGGSKLTWHLHYSLGCQASCLQCWRWTLKATPQGSWHHSVAQLSFAVSQPCRLDTEELPG